MIAERAIRAFERRRLARAARFEQGYCYTDRDFDPFDPLDPEVARDCVGPLDVGATPIGASPSTNLALDVWTPSGLITTSGTRETGFTLESTTSIALPIWPLEPTWVLHDDVHGTAIVVAGNGTYVIRPIP